MELILEACELVTLTGCRLLEVWGLALLLAPAGLVAIAIWDFADWRRGRGGK